MNNKKEKEYKSYVKIRSKQGNSALVHLLDTWKLIDKHCITDIESIEKITSQSNIKDALQMITGCKEEALKKSYNDVIRIVYPHLSKSSDMFRRITFMLSTQISSQINVERIENSELMSSARCSVDRDREGRISIPDSPRRSLQGQPTTRSFKKEYKEYREPKESNENKEKIVIMKVNIVDGNSIQRSASSQTDLRRRGYDITDNNEVIIQTVTESNGADVNQKKKKHTNYYHLMESPPVENDERRSLDIENRGPNKTNFLDSLKERPRMSDVELRRNSITVIESDIPAHRFLVAAFNMLLGRLKHYRLQYIGPLLAFLMSHYIPFDAYFIAQSFVDKTINYCLFPFTTIQFDYYFIAFDEIINERYPDYVKSLTSSLTEVYEDLIINMFVPLLLIIDKFSALMILKNIYLFGAPFIIKFICILLDNVQDKPLSSKEYYKFVDIVNKSPNELIGKALELQLPEYINRVKLLYVKETLHMDLTIMKGHESNMKLVKERLVNLEFPTDIIDKSVGMDFISMIPERYVVMDFVCLYCSKNSGFSLTNLYALATSFHPLILFIETDCHEVFGAFISDCLHISSKFYGTGETFLFTIKPNCKKYSATTANNYFVVTDSNKIAFGGGEGLNGLKIDIEFKGETYHCPTFDNEPLSKNNHFNIIRVDVWTCSSIATIDSIKKSEASSIQSND